MLKELRCRAIHKPQGDPARRPNHLGGHIIRSLGTFKYRLYHGGFVLSDNQPYHLLCLIQYGNCQSHTWKVRLSSGRGNRQAMGFLERR